ncbi:uncharacterized protein BX664DRAFT_362455 [Halteromyces radiatus]|uniref:uncharacterized protein n=1 Tax=Halteromyces radiatus TaxID=101107 RepID=UPI0022206581|nr:uncharacterized protein BX664DRAFT_362455 [Halteromyces radiatus]KAI8078912.1 hypothetical protein BX664DRAFT_362455 [Halteromyces radiatus]
MRAFIPTALLQVSVVDSILRCCLQFDVIAPKERRSGIRIIKLFLIHPHRSPTLCPVRCFLAVRDHPAATSRPQDALFVKSNEPSVSIKITTISSWIRTLLKFSTIESRVSLRSLGSSIALQEGIDLDDIATLGNWKSTDTFNTHYRRQHMSQVDFTNKIIDVNLPPVQLSTVLQDNDDTDADDDDEDTFLDALE